MNWLDLNPSFFQKIKDFLDAGIEYFTGGAGGSSGQFDLVFDYEATEYYSSFHYNVNEEEEGYDPEKSFLPFLISADPEFPE